MSTHDISFQRAREMVDRYRAHRNSILKPEYQGQNLLLIAETFDRAAFDELLAEPGCAKIRLYYGMDETLRVHAIFVAANANDEDIIPEESSSATEAFTGIQEEGAPCPDFCPPPGKLYP